MLIYFATLAGAVQMISPDHWMPISVFSWQRGWRMSGTILFSLPFFVIHVGLGLALYFILQRPLAIIPESRLALFTICFLAVLGLLRALHFSKQSYSIHRWSSSNNEVLSRFMPLVLFLGPSEVLIPVLMKARMDQADFRLPVTAFLLGTLLSGAVLVGRSRFLWNRPMMLPKVVDWARGRLAVYPVALGAFMGALLLTHLLNH